MTTVEEINSNLDNCGRQAQRLDTVICTARAGVGTDTGAEPAPRSATWSVSVTVDSDGLPTDVTLNDAVDWRLLVGSSGPHFSRALVNANLSAVHSQVAGNWPSLVEGGRSALPACDVNPTGQGSRPQSVEEVRARFLSAAAEAERAPYRPRREDIVRTGSTENLTVELSIEGITRCAITNLGWAQDPYRTARQVETEIMTAVNSVRPEVQRIIRDVKAALQPDFSALEAVLADALSILEGLADGTWSPPIPAGLTRPSISYARLVQQYGNWSA
jgi:hypothetical protein